MKSSSTGEKTARDARRAFLKTAGRAAATVPAAALLLSLSDKSAVAQQYDSPTE